MDNNEIDKDSIVEEWWDGLDCDDMDYYLKRYQPGVLFVTDFVKRNIYAKVFEEEIDLTL
jgi:hypothetical protein